MTDPARHVTRRRRLGALAGFVFVASLLVAPDPSLPEGATASQTRQFYLDSQQDLGLMLVLVGVGYVLFMYFVAVFQAEGRRTGSGTDSAATLILMSAALIAGFYVLGSALRAVPATGAAAGASVALVEVVARTAESSSDAIVEISTYWRGLLLAASAALIHRSMVVPKWVGWLAALLAVTSFAGGFSFVDSPLQDPLGTLGFVSYVLFHLWVLVASVTLALGGRRTSTPESQLPAQQLA